MLTFSSQCMYEVSFLMINQITNLSFKSTSSVTFSSKSLILLISCVNDISFGMKINGAKPRPAVWKQCTLFLSIGSSPTDNIARSTNTFRSAGPPTKYFATLHN